MDIVLAIKTASNKMCTLSWTSADCRFNTTDSLALSGKYSVFNNGIEDHMIIFLHFIQQGSHFVFRPDFFKDKHAEQCRQGNDRYLELYCRFPCFSVIGDE